MRDSVAPAQTVTCMQRNILISKKKLSHIVLFRIISRLLISAMFYTKFEITSVSTNLDNCFSKTDIKIYKLGNTSLGKNIGSQAQARIIPIQPFYLFNLCLWKVW